MENKTYKQGDILMFKGLEWYVIKDNESTIDLLPTKVLSEELPKIKEDFKLFP